MRSPLVQPRLWNEKQTILRWEHIVFRGVPITSEFRVYFIIQKAEIPLCVQAINKHVYIYFKYNDMSTNQHINKYKKESAKGILHNFKMFPHHICMFERKSLDAIKKPLYLKQIISVLYQCRTTIVKSFTYNIYVWLMPKTHCNMYYVSI